MGLKITATAYCTYESQDLLTWNQSILKIWDLWLKNLVFPQIVFMHQYKNELSSWSHIVMRDVLFVVFGHCKFFSVISFLQLIGTWCETTFKWLTMKVLLKVVYFLSQLKENWRNKNLKSVNLLVITLYTGSAWSDFFWCFPFKLNPDHTPFRHKRRHTFRTVSPTLFPPSDPKKCVWKKSYNTFNCQVQIIYEYL